MIYPYPLPWRRPRAEALRRPWSRRKRWKTVLASLALAVLAVIAAGLVGLAVTMARLRPTLPTIAQIAAFRPVEATTIWSSDGVLLAKLQMENRQVVPLQAVSPFLVNATLAVEDNRFYRHNGLDYRGIARAAASNLLRGDSTGQGGSTITQQLARNVSQFGISREKNLTRKLREAMTAVRIEQVFDKDQILELYLNQIYYGSGAYGVEAAARTYFGKPAKKLTLAESALLAGLPQRPQVYSPYTNREAARRRRDVVLQRMLETGRITRGQYARATEEPIHLTARHAQHTVYRAPYFVDWVTRDLVDRYGVDAVYSGWKIVTTLDWKMQKAAEKTLRSGLSYGATQGALVSLDPQTGGVRAMVGGVDYRRDRFNAVTQGLRQPGSAFKPFVYAAALDTGAVTLTDTVKDEPVEYDTGGRKTYIVHNYAGYSGKEMTILDAITRSVNTIAVETANSVGLEQVIAYAHAMGIRTELAPYLPLALGASAVRPLDLAAAYGVFASGGDRYAPTGITLVTDSHGRVVEKDTVWKRHTPGVLQRTTVDQMNLALREVVLHGTGQAASGVPNAFGKTGTTNDRRDAWFVGYTPELVTAVWVANPYRDRRGVVRYRVMGGATGGRAAAPLWARFMRQAVPVQLAVNRRRGVMVASIFVPPLPEREPEKTAEAPDAENAQVAGWYDAREGASGGTMLARADDGVNASFWQPTAGQSVVVGRQAAESLPGGATADDRTVLVDLCADTGRPATEWCPTTVMVRMPASRAPAGACTRHRPPPGE